LPNHELKTHPGSFDAVWAGDKTAELRLFDRDYRVGDNLVLRRYLPDVGRYDGRMILARVTHILLGSEHLASGYGMLSIRVMTKNEFDPAIPDEELLPRISEFEVRWAADGDAVAEGSMRGKFLSWSISESIRATPGLKCLTLHGPSEVDGEAPPHMALCKIRIREAPEGPDRSWEGRVVYWSGPAKLRIEIFRVPPSRLDPAASAL
jgi:hypothetical protein